MSEELKEELQTNEAEETTAEKPEETMADYEEHFDDANPWNRVTEYMEKQTILPVKVEGVVNGGVIVMVEGYQDGMFDLVKPELVRASYPLFIKKMNEIAAVIDSSGTVFTLPNVDEAMKL